MENGMTDAVRRWSAGRNDRQKLQAVYLVLGIAVVLAAGLVTFLNTEVGYVMLNIGLILIGVFILNGVAWHLSSSILLNRLSEKPRRVSTAPVSRKK